MKIEAKLHDLDTYSTDIQSIVDYAIAKGIPLNELHVEASTDYDVGYLDWYHHREETPEEAKAREDQQKRWNEKDKEYRRQQYEKLKKEFE